MKRILVTGSRDWTHAEPIRRKLLEHGPGIVVHGACRGADTLADEIARELGWPVEQHPADWDTHGRAAGPTRNRAMVAIGADVCRAFARCDSRGTHGTVALARTAGIPVELVQVCDVCEARGCFACRDRGFLELSWP